MFYLDKSIFKYGNELDDLIYRNFGFICLNYYFEFNSIRKESLVFKIEQNDKSNLFLKYNTDSFEQYWIRI